MGVSGSGKSTLGKALGSVLNVPFIEGDDFHPLANIEKMKKSIPLTDTDRKPWLISLAEELSSHQKQGAVLACSALKESYRNLLLSKISADHAFWIYLKCDEKKLIKRIEMRNHFMPSSLLRSQLETLEEPKDALQLKDSLSVKQMIKQIKKTLDEH